MVMVIIIKIISIITFIISNIIILGFRYNCIIISHAGLSQITSLQKHSHYHCNHPKSSTIILQPELPPCSIMRCLCNCTSGTAIVDSVYFGLQRNPGWKAGITCRHYLRLRNKSIKDYLYDSIPFFLFFSRVTIYMICANPGDERGLG